MLPLSGGLKTESFCHGMQAGHRLILENVGVGDARDKSQDRWCCGPHAGRLEQRLASSSRAYVVFLTECRLLAIGAGNGRGRVRVCTVDENPGNMAIVQASDRRETGRGVSLSGRAVNKTRYKVELVLWKFHVFFHAKLGRNERSA